MEEIWKDVEGYEGLYQVSNLGKVRRRKVLKLKKETTGYLRVCLCKNNIKTTHHVHRLVAQAFIFNKDNKRTVNHIDGNKLNNNIDNLEWATYKENIDHSFDTGLNISKGSKHKLSKLTEDNVIKIRELYGLGKYNMRQLAEMFNVTRPNIGNIINNKTWKHIK